MGGEQICGYCGKLGAVLKCGQCRMIRFCDTSCQKAGWKEHKACCQILEGIQLNNAMHDACEPNFNKEFLSKDARLQAKATQSKGMSAFVDHIHDMGLEVQPDLPHEQIIELVKCVSKQRIEVIAKKLVQTWKSVDLASDSEQGEADGSISHVLKKQQRRQEHK